MCKNGKIDTFYNFLLNNRLWVAIQSVERCILSYHYCSVLLVSAMQRSILNCYQLSVWFSVSCIPFPFCIKEQSEDSFTPEIGRFLAGILPVIKTEQTQAKQAIFTKAHHIIICSEWVQ